MTEPNRWLIIHINDHLYKVFATWGGGYLDGDSWKLNSGITKVEEDGDYFLVHGYSGSVYKLHKNGRGATAWTYNVLGGFVEKAKNAGHTIEIMDEDFDLMGLNDELPAM